MFKRMEKRNKILVIIFLISLLLPAIDFIFRLDPAPPRNENRAKATFPPFPQDIKELKLFFSGFDSYYADNFGLRNSLISIYALFKYYILNTSPSSLILQGKNGWYFLKDQKNIELYRNIKPFTQTEIDNFLNLIKERMAWAKKNGIHYVFLVGPDSHTLNPENLPNWVTKVGPHSRWDQLLEQAHMMNLPLLDVRQALIEAKKDGDISYQTDTHWNVFGGYIAYRELINYFRKQIPNMGPPIPFSEYSLVKTKRKGLDLALLAGLQSFMYENNSEAIYRGTRTYSESPRENLHFSTTNENGEDFTIACVCDSMAGNLYPHLARQFKNMRVLWGYPFNAQEIKQYKADIVIQLIIERTLLWVQIDNPTEVKAAIQ